MSTADSIYPELSVRRYYYKGLCTNVLTEAKFKMVSFSGDHFYKRNKALPPEEQMISAMPDIKILTLNEEHDFMVLACDGIW